MDIMKKKDKVLKEYFINKEKIKKLEYIIASIIEDREKLEGKLQESTEVSLPNANTNNSGGGGNYNNSCYYEEAIINRMSLLQKKIKDKNLLIFEKETEIMIIKTEIDSLRIAINKLSYEEKDFLDNIYLKKLSNEQIINKFNISKSTLYRKKQTILEKII